MRFRLTAALLGFAALATLTTVSAKAETVLRFNNFLPRTTFIFSGTLEPWAKRVEKATNSRVKVEFTASSLGAPPAQFDLVQNGVADVAFSIAGYTPDRIMLTQAAELPFTGDSSEAISVALWRVHQKHFAEAKEFKGVKLIGLYTSVPSHLYMLKGPIEKLDDLRGLKLRVAGPVPGAIAEGLGAVPVGAPGVKAVEMLNAGIIDGTFFSHDGIIDLGLEDDIKYVTTFPKGLFNTVFYIVMNEDAWNKLPKKDQEAIESVSGEAFAKTTGEAYDAFAEKALQMMKDAGVTVTPASEELIAKVQEIAVPLRENWAAAAKDKRNIDGEAALKMLEKEVSSYGK